MNLKNVSTIKINRIEHDLEPAELDDPAWQQADETIVTKYWSGKDAPVGRHFKARLLWSEVALYVRFEATQAEPLVVSDVPNLRAKTIGLWDRDVCEIFLAPDSADPNRYFEFEVAPTGEWIDVGVVVTPHERLSDWDYDSGMTAAARIDDGRVFMSARVPWTAFDKTPVNGEIWAGNLYRCVGTDPTRGYLAWQITETENPNFHVPARFGSFEFISSTF